MIRAFQKHLLLLIFFVAFSTGCTAQNQVTEFFTPENWSYVLIWSQKKQNAYGYPSLELPLPTGMGPNSNPNGTLIDAGPDFDTNREDYFIVLITPWDNRKISDNCKDYDSVTNFVRNSVRVEKLLLECSKNFAYRLSVSGKDFYIEPVSKTPNRWSEKWILTSLLNARIVED